MYPTGVASALSVSASAPSKVPFYVAGGALALWAVGLAAMGITRPGFPGTSSRARAVMAASAALVVTTMTAAVLTGGDEGQEEPAAAALTSTMQLSADPNGVAAFDRKEATLRAGPVTIRFANPAPLEHNVVIASGSRALARSKTIQGGSTELRADLPAGEYVFFCSVDGHRQAGMEGSLTVR
jgi:plastocyanin